MNKKSNSFCFSSFKKIQAPTFAMLMLSLMLGLPGTLSAQKTWTGAISTDWNTGSNWSPVGVPTPTDDVIIPDVGNDPVISTAAVAKSVTVQASGSLINKSILTINGATEQGILNNGTVSNTGSLIIGSTSIVGQFGIMNQAIFENSTGATISIDNSTTSGLTHWSGTFTNHGDITIGANAGVGAYGLYNQATFNNMKDGRISVDTSNNIGLYNLDLGKFFNQGDIIIGANAGVGSYGLVNLAIFNNSGGTISIDNSTSAGFYNVAGIFANKANITIGTNAGVGDYGLYNQAAFHNNTGGMISIDNSTNTGFYNAAGTVTNQANITIGASAGAGVFGLNNLATFDNNTGGAISIDNVINIGLYNFNGTFTNQANITIGANAGVGDYGLVNIANFNNTGGTISIDNSTDSGLYNYDAGDFTNQGVITIGANASAGYNGLHNIAAFNNNPSAVISIDNSINSGLYNDDAGTFNNQAAIVIGTSAGAGIFGLHNRGTFYNNPGGEVLIDNSNIYGLYNHNTGNFTNHAGITIGASAGVGDHGLVNQGIVDNADGTISIDNSNGTGLSNFSGTFTNQAKITIGANAGVGAFGLNNQTTFNNQACGEIAMFAPISNIASFTNAGIFRVNTASAHANTALTNNGIIEYPQGNPILNVTNNEIIVLPSAGDCQVPDALLRGNPVDFSIATNWYFNPNLTQLAGTYNAASNVFTPTIFVDNVIRIVYFAITDGSGGCSRTVSKKITFDDTEAPMISCPANATVNLSTACKASVGVRTLASKSDNCTPSASISQTQSPPATVLITGHNTVQVVTITASDMAGNTQTCTMTVTAKDITPPNITCPANITTTNNTGLCSSMVEYFAPTVTDNCSATLSLQSGLASGSAFPVGVNTVVYRATDAAGSTKTCSFKVTVNDTQLPLPICPANQVKTGSGSPCTAVATYSNATFTDNCPGGSILRISGLASGLPFPSGVNTIVFRATDASNNSRTCSFTITVNCGNMADVIEERVEREVKTGDNACEQTRISNQPFSMSPNPTTGLFQILLQGNDKESVVMIYDAVGRTVWQQKVAPETTQVQVDLSGGSFVNGTYWVTLISEESVSSKKLILSTL